MKKILSVLLTLLLVISTMTTNVFAVAKKEVLALDKTNKCDQILMGMKSFKEVMKKYPKAELVSKNESYVLCEAKGDSTPAKTEYTKSEYDQLINEKSKLISPMNLDHDFGWIYVSTYGYDLGNGRYYVCFAYDWKTIPRYQLVDAIVIGANSNLNLDTPTIYAWHEITTIFNPIGYSYNINSSDMQCRGANTYGVNVPLSIDSHIPTLDACGAISCEGIKATSVTTSAKYFGSYGHRQVSLNLSSFSFSPTSMSFGFSMTPSYDQAPLSDIIYTY